MKKIIYSLTLFSLIFVAPLHSVEFQRNVDFVDASIVGDYSYMKQEMRRGMKIDTPRGNFSYPTALMKAIGRQDMKMINFCLRYRASVNRRDPALNTPLMMAVATGNQKIVNLLLRRGASHRLVNNVGQGVLTNAAIKNDLSMVRLLLRRGARADKNMALVYAAKASNADMVKLLLRYGASVYYENRDWGTGLSQAVQTGNIESVKAILARNRKLINRSVLSGRGGLSPLAVATQMDDIVMMKYLISRGASIYYKNREGKSLLFMAPPRASLFLLSKGLSAKTKDKYGISIMMRYCIGKGYADLRVVKELVRRGASVQEKNRHGMSLLMGAASAGKFDIVKLLVEKGANINYTDSRGNSAVAYAARSGHSDVEKYLISRGGRKSSARHKGSYYYPYKKQNPELNSLKRGVHENNTSVIEQLVTTGIENHTRNQIYSIVVKTAVADHNMRILKWALKKGEPLNKDAVNTAYVFTAARDLSLVKELLASGAELNARKGAALVAAIASKNNDIAAYLVKKGINNKETKETLTKALVQNATSGKYFIIKDLIRYGADCKTLYGAKAVIAASQHRGYYLPKKIIALLVGKGAEKNYKNYIGRTAVDSAAVRKNTRLIQWMRSRGFKRGKEIAGKSEAQKRYADTRRVRRLLNEAYRGSLRNVRILVNSGIDINSQNSSGNTVLHMAAYGRKSRIVHGLIRLGADKNIKDKKGQTARDIAVKKNDRRFIEALDSSKPYRPKKKTDTDRKKYANKKDYNNNYRYRKDSNSRYYRKGTIRPMPGPPGKRETHGVNQVVPQNIKGLKIYGSKSCGRCIGFKRKLNREGIKYTFIDIGGNKNYGARKYMWSKMRQQGYRGGSVSYPILELKGRMLWPDRKKHFTGRGVFWVDKYYKDYLNLGK